ncbi:hypothetical protein QQF64_028859 [Cirrhinus molitorella]|uniref:Integrase catalytic domain-containing protein n=1 Tax=Cirrhinus molitorella TaxID=172907 RepID=A0ABR3N899_9TELE
MNHVLKDCVQTASLEGQPWKTSVRDFLLHYRTTPHSTTGVAPSELLLGRQLRTNLHILPTRPSACTDATVRAHVHARQSQIKTYTDIKRAAKLSALRPGDRVCVRIPTHVKKKQVEIQFAVYSVGTKRPGHIYSG